MSRAIRHARKDRYGRVALFVAWLGLAFVTSGISVWYVTTSFQKLNLTCENLSLGGIDAS